MAWFNKGAQPAPQLTPATIARACAFFDAQGWHYQVDEEDGSVYLGLNGALLRILEADAVLGIMSQGEAAGEGEDVAAQVLQWITQWHAGKVAPTGYVNLDEDSNRVTANFFAAMPRAWDYSDAQFEDNLVAYLEMTALCAREFFQEFNPAFLQEVDGGSDGEGADTAADGATDGAADGTPGSE